MRELIHRDILAVLTDLPEFCYARMPGTGAPIILKRGHVGYWPAGGNRNVEEANAGLTAAQVAAMAAGSHFGFDCAGADPLNYPELANASDYDAIQRQRWATRTHGDTFMPWALNRSPAWRPT